MDTILNTSIVSQEEYYLLIKLMKILKELTNSKWIFYFGRHKRTKEFNVYSIILMILGINIRKVNWPNIEITTLRF
jgi:hypothetical protein